MNAIIGLCHFCESHGPRPLFCTFTTDDESHTTESSKYPVECSGCRSIGAETVLVSKDDSGIIYCSRESVPNDDVTAFLRQAALRSITCEVNWSKEGGVVYFSDTQGHVLSHMFHLKDTRARGLKRLFSIVVLMKDKMFLLNVTPVLSEHMKKIAKQLQELADVVYDNEQSICSQRALRLKTGKNDFGQSRSLKQLTNDDDIFKRLHSHFTWMLKSGALIYSETLYTSQYMLNKFHPNTTKGTIFEDICSVTIDNSSMSLRDAENLLSKEAFRTLLYCLLTGAKIGVISKYRNLSSVVNGLLIILPKNTDKTCENIRIVSHAEEIQAQNICILEEVETNIFHCTWKSNGPAKYPTLMNKILNAINNEKFNDVVLLQHIKSLQLEWLGIANTIKSSLQASGHKKDAIKKLKVVLGVTEHDEILVNYWIQAFCD
ncbi:folliculin [Zerene cesonia]|uniref:folliculin n=1 Tax=Zerene cesonia TaxID=33412 RepID=UPI0018E56536|nr:folliculin [Zerene cesonia]